MFSCDAYLSCPPFSSAIDLSGTTRGDVSEAASVANLVKRVKEELPNNPLGGIAHAAGIIDFVDLQSQTAERMGKVFKPKAGPSSRLVGGAWHLHEATKEEIGTAGYGLEESLKSFLGFSSVSALIGRGPAEDSRLKLTLRMATEKPPLHLAEADHAGQADSALMLLPPGHVKAAVKLALTGEGKAEAVEWGRFLRELGAEIPVLQDFAGEEERLWGGLGETVGGGGGGGGGGDGKSYESIHGDDGTSYEMMAMR
eukprot:Skav203428  [mRNA]  locus=scaffold1743:433119:436594:- [translate_table: standard]